MDEGEEVLQRIVGARLTSVQFVLNYLILGFDEKGALTTLVWPELLHELEAVRFGMPGYRDKLCELIEERVRSVKIEEDETIVLTLNASKKIRIPLRANESDGERAIFTSSEHVLFVW